MVSTFSILPSLCVFVCLRVSSSFRVLLHGDVSSQRRGSFLSRGRYSNGPFRERGRVSLQAIGLSEETVTQTEEKKKVPTSEQDKHSHKDHRTSAHEVNGVEDDGFVFHGVPITFHAIRTASIEVEEKNRTLTDYLSLPPTDYSILSEGSIERLNDTHFQYKLDPQKFFNVQVGSTLITEVVVDPSVPSSLIQVKDFSMDIRPLASRPSGKLLRELQEVVRSTNVNSYGLTKGINLQERRAGAGHGREAPPMIETKMEIKVSAKVPKRTLVPARIVEATGSFVLQRILNIILPRFLKQLRADFDRWSAGSADRSALSQGGLAELEMAEDEGVQTDEGGPSGDDILNG
uniref:Uncharacterized protein n=1 Tax=Chromera velia CCMP2878 TaxID=1169474 RepID=A0A0G4IAI8_9ALVE|mmetsp:Transcript_29318/g.57554  ORF Transcript_29318/g.57554 Transcript_29318/m.57554 type:complete len:347 (-) Transcript_29318:563-1603(-)|eukprot:Cvel_12571.t1-p1 / transcript=Cvel_12571.t1 / gene=Cvel_12571 / organism=Chromera_velia_CCMP2878 / gene_product=hypothetical protein / transcript_product=hypothetical protein / location=Cvel_scaffold827:56267-59895(+) / protein_length=346 / sequence_SO=supercontig / SO=protein_coding / is_pseudo=false